MSVNGVVGAPPATVVVPLSGYLPCSATTLAVNRELGQTTRPLRDAP